LRPEWEDTGWIEKDGFRLIRRVGPITFELEPSEPYTENSRYYLDFNINLRHITLSKEGSEKLTQKRAEEIIDSIVQWLLFPVGEEALEALSE
jgi:hypothetical protein